ncbi:LytR family transcriptional regulator, partial [Xanthomonas citri pv. citri]|nr:LytR family transcriptional regulator [Xanthomonas citri pv. citri]
RSDLDLPKIKDKDELLNQRVIDYYGTLVPLTELDDSLLTKSQKDSSEDENSNENQSNENDNSNSETNNAEDYNNQQQTDQFGNEQNNV